MLHFPLQNNWDILSSLSQAIFAMLRKAVLKSSEEVEQAAFKYNQLLKVQSLLFKHKFPVGFLCLNTNFLWVVKLVVCFSKLLASQHA